MKKEVFVTAGLCKVKDQIAEAARNPVAEKMPGTADVPPAGPVSALDSLPETTRKAVLARQQEFEQFRRDLRFRLHEAVGRTAQAEAAGREQADTLLSLKNQLDELIGQLEKQQAADEFSPDFQMQLANNFRQLEKMRLELIRIQAAMPAASELETSRKSNLFAELDSVTFGQIFRLGWAFFLPLILTLLFSSILLALAMIFTFRVI